MTTLREKFPIVPFAGTNFSTWSFRIKSILRENGVLEAIEDEGFKDVAGNSAKEAKAQAILIGVADSHIEYMKKESAFAMFKNLEENFKKRVRSKLFLRRQLSETKYRENHSLIEHFTKMEEIFTELKEADTVLSEEEKVNYVLLSMPQTYEGIITALETIENLKLDFVKNRLLGEEEKRKKNSKEFEKVQHANAFSCFVCGKPGHKKYQCNMKERNQSEQGNYQPTYGHYPRGCGNYQGQRRGNNQGQGRGNYQVQGRGHHQGQGRGYNRGYRQGWSQNQGRGQQAYNTENNESRDVVFLCENSEVHNLDISNEDCLVWCIDSGCSDHLVIRTFLWII